VVTGSPPEDGVFREELHSGVSKPTGTEHNKSVLEHLGSTGDKVGQPANGTRRDNLMRNVRHEVKRGEHPSYRGGNGSRNIEDDGHDRVEVEEHEHRRGRVGDQRDEEVDQTTGSISTCAKVRKGLHLPILEQQAHELRATLEGERELER
jgi:hypothetical protein